MNQDDGIFKYRTVLVDYTELASKLNELTAKGFQIFDILDTEKTNIKIVLYLERINEV